MVRSGSIRCLGLWPNDVYLVGWAYDAAAEVPLLYHNDGTGWAAATLVLPAGSSFANLSGARGPVADDIQLVGVKKDAAELKMPLHYQNNGTGWTESSPTLSPGWYGFLADMWGADASDEDVLTFTPTSLGDVTGGTWSMYFDGSDVELSQTSDEDVDALDIVGTNIYLSTLGNFSVSGTSGADEDVFVCAATSIGEATACNYSSSLYFDGSTWGLSANDVDAFNVLAPGPVSTPTSTTVPAATNTPTCTPTATATPVATGTLTFEIDADARVSEASPGMNYGNATTLQVDSGSGAAETSYLRFVVSGINGSIQRVKLRIYCTTNGTNNGPAAYLADNNWLEAGITWNSQPALLSIGVDNKGLIATSSWVEYDVTSLVTGNGTYTLALVGDGTDGVTFSSSEGVTPPELVIEILP